MHFPAEPVIYISPETRVGADPAALQLPEGDEVNGYMILVNFYLRALRGRIQERALDLAARQVFGVHDAVHRMPAFAAQVELLFVVLV